MVCREKFVGIAYIFTLVILSMTFISGLELNSCNDSLISGTYTVTQDITADLDPCFSFTEDNIILDCQGYTIDGDLSMLTGFEAISLNNITIRNCTIANFLSYGIYLESVSGSNLQNLLIQDIFDDFLGDGTGLYLLDSSQNVFDTISIDSSYLDGMYVIESYNNSFIRNNVSYAYDGYGIWVEDSSYNVFEKLAIKNNAYGGVTFLFTSLGSNNNTVYDSKIINNGDYIEGGINIYDSTGNLFYNNLLNNTLNVYIDNPSDENFWNKILTSGTNIIGGDYIGGNYWANPSGDGFSENCTNYTNGICDDDYDINSDGINVDYLPLTYDESTPLISNVSHSSITSNSATIKWSTSKSSNSTVEYGPDLNMSLNSSNSNLVISHSIKLTGLSPKTTYYYNVTSCDSYNCNESGSYNFTTLAAVVAPPSSGGGGGGSSGSTTLTVDEQKLLKGYTKEVKKKWKIKITRENETIFITIEDILNDSIQISFSNGLGTLNLETGETKKINLDNDEYYDLQIALNSVGNSKAEITLKSINEKIPTPEVTDEGGSPDLGEEGTSSTKTITGDVISGGDGLKSKILIPIIIVVVIIVFWFINKKKA